MMELYSWNCCLPALAGNVSEISEESIKVTFVFFCVSLFLSYTMIYIYTHV